GGTLATVKALTPDEVAGSGARIALVNAYHLYLRPGHRLIESLGGVHRFMGWNGPILSDSGGYQVFSLARLLRVDDEGVRFRSHLDGSEHHYTPELAIEVQSALGVDIAMPLDHVLPGDAPAPDQRDAAERTLRWFDRSRALDPAPALFAIVQGGVDEDLRRRHARELAARKAPGYAIGGLSVGESKAEQYAMTEVACADLPVDRPRYLMGVGSPEDLVHAVAAGVDLFDCVLPTRLGRTGSLFTDDGRVNIKSARFRDRGTPLNSDCGCTTCGNYSAAYLNHLFRNDELLGYRLASIHNLCYIHRLCERMREAVLKGVFDAFADEFLARYQPADEAARTEQRARWETRPRA
ncbi:MAG: tRNA guanosine(34) transglycosylase Tgt, partial [Dehalococcoidia bacterium]|nr:tRNA guanosine(34) transglycosylase Tgt [Dehalococcoidia bacterium]